MHVDLFIYLPTLSDFSRAIQKSSYTQKKSERPYVRRYTNKIERYIKINSRFTCRTRRIRSYEYFSLFGKSIRCV